MTPLRLTPTGVNFMGRRFPCAIGKGGVRLSKREGDGATPAGVHHIVGMLYRPDRLAAPQVWAEPILPQDRWSDDSAASDYNQLVRAPYGHGCEILRRADPLYDVVFITDYNYPNAEAGKGSAIFLHQWRRPRFPTEGCIAFRRDHLMWIAKRVSLGAKVIVPATLAADS